MTRNTTEMSIRIRPMIFSDLSSILEIDKEIRATGTQVAYRDLATSAYRIFGIERDAADPAKEPDILEAAKVVDHSFVAECDGTICGFIVGRQLYLAESNIQQGEIALIAVHPNYTGKGIASQLIDALFKLFRSRDIHRVGISADPNDKGMLSFLERSGFTSNRLLSYTRKI